MRFLVLAAEEDSYAKWDAMTEAERNVHFAAMEQFAVAVKERGAMIDGGALDRPDAARTVRPGDAPSRQVTEGRSPKPSSRWVGSGWSSCPTWRPPSRPPSCCPRRTPSRCGRFWRWVTDV